MNELRERGVEIRFLAPWDINLPDFPDITFDAAYVPSNMLHRGSTFELLHRLLILRELEKKSKVVNPVDSMLHYSDILTPKTLATENIDKAFIFASCLLEAGRDVVIKPICKARGVGVVKLSGIRSRGDLLQFLAWYSREHAEGVFYLQEYIPNKGHDIRILIVDGEVVGRERRYNPDDFRYNVSVGGSAEAFNDPIYDKLALEVANLSELKIAGIDILPGENGKPYVLEANCFPGYKALMDATGIPVHVIIADYLQNLT
jgi:glutathione synthase/RimK-type ligase-like ATP-grasp enzyme